MIEYKEPNAYEIIQNDIILKFNLYLKIPRKEIKTIVVVGAYVGLEIAKLLYYYSDSNIIAFEAYPKNYERLFNNYKNNPRVTTHNLAISDIKGEVDFYELCDIGNGSLLRSGTPDKIIDSIKIPSDRLDNIVKEDIDLLWVDVQGAELQVLKGTDLSKVKSMFLEIAVKKLQDPTNPQYKEMCYLEDLEDYLKETHTLHSIGLDNFGKNGCGNSFWIGNKYGS